MKNKDTLKTEMVSFSVYTPGLLKEIVECWWSSMSGMRMPILIFRNILGQVAQRASEINDTEMNRLMCKLWLYAVSDPYDPDYDPDLMREMGVNRSSNNS